MAIATRAPGALLESIHADDDSVAGVDGDLRQVRGFLDLALDKPGLDRRERAAHAGNRLEQRLGAALDAVGQRFDDVRAADGVHRVGDAGFGRDDLLRPQGDSRGLLARQRQRLVSPIAVQRLRSPEDRGERLQRHAHDVVVRLLRRQRAASGLRVEAELLSLGLGRAEAVAHDARPQPSGRAELGDLFEKVVVRVEEERQPLAEPVDVEPRVDRRLHVRHRVREGEGDLLYRRRSRFADVVPADRNRVPLRQLVLAVREDVRHDPERSPRRVDVRAPRHVLLEDVVLDGPGELRLRDPLLSGHRDVER